MNAESFEEPICVDKQSIAHNIQKDVPVVAYLDNGIVTKLRRGSNYEMVNQISSLFKKYNVQHVLMTDKLFIEVIGHGKFRRNFIKNNKEHIEPQKRKFKNK